MTFLVGAFLVKRARLLQWLVFFRQTTDIIVYVPLFTETTKTTQANSDQCNLIAKGPPFIFYLFYVTYKTGRDPFNFFGTVRIFFNVSKESLLRVFWYFATECMLTNPKGSPLLHFSVLCNIFRKKNVRSFFQTFFCSQSGEKWFPSHIEHERYTLGVSKLFSKLFVNTSWAY